MDEDTDWLEEERHFNRLYRTRNLVSELIGELTAAQREECLNFLTKDDEIKDGLQKLSTLASPENPTNLAPLFSDISNIHKLIEQMSAKIDNLPVSYTQTDKTINGSIHATTPCQKSADPKPLYNTVARQSQMKLQQPTVPETKTLYNPKTPHHPSRLVVQFKPNGIPATQRPDPNQIVNNINASLAQNPQAKHMKVVTANFNNQGNLIISTRTDQTAEELMKFKSSFSQILTNLDNKQEITVREDKKWFKIQVDGVNTSYLSIANGRVTHTPDDVHAELMSCNPLYANSIQHLSAKPRWLRTEEELISTHKSSLVFALTDEPTARLFLKQKALAAFGNYCTLRAFQDRPPVTQCRNCWSLEHTTHNCKEYKRCRLCSALHDEKDHPHPDPNNCQKCLVAREYGDSMDTTAEGHCPHDLRCANCIANNNADQNHPADARRCPIRLEKYGTARENERRTQKSNNPWIRVKPKKNKTKTTNETHSTTPNTPLQNRFQPLNDDTPPPHTTQTPATQYTPEQHQ